MPEMLSVNSRTRLCCVFGDPVDHSLSPQMHNAVYKKLGLNARYLAFRVKPEDLRAALEGCRVMNVRGINLTIPHKYDVLPFLDEIDEEARLIGAVNTVLIEKGKTIGYNTDGRGYVRSLNDRYPNFRFKNQKVVIAGAGGAARGICVACANKGAHVTIINRTAEKARKLAASLNRVFKGRFQSANLDDREAFANADLFINTTSVGMKAPRDSIIRINFFEKRSIIVSDIVYTPRETKLLKDAKKRALKTLEGWGMLAHQGVLAHDIWFAEKAPANVMIRALLKNLGR